MQRNQVTAAAFAALLFVGGAAVGALGHRYYAATTVLLGRLKWLATATFRKCKIA